MYIAIFFFVISFSLWIYHLLVAEGSPVEYSLVIVLGLLISLLIGVIGGAVSLPLGLCLDKTYQGKETFSIHSLKKNSLKKGEIDFYEIDFFTKNNDTIYLIPAWVYRKHEEVHSKNIKFIVDDSYKGHGVFDLYVLDSNWSFAEGLKEARNVFITTSNPVHFNQVRTTEKIEN